MKTSRQNVKIKKTTIEQPVISALEDLFQFSGPHQLRNSLMEIFFSYLCNTKAEELKPEMMEIATDFYCLIKFLEIGEEYQKK